MKLPHITRISELYELTEEIGFLPFFSCEIPGFSLMDITRPEYWWSDIPELDPWQWRIQAAEEKRIAYGKFFRGKAGFISREWLPVFANYRRQGYDYDSLYEEGLASHRSKLIMKLFERDDATIPSFEIKRLAGFGSGGEKGYEGAITSLQMQLYLTVCGFERKRNRLGVPYGWPVGVLTTAEAAFGCEHIRSRYCEAPEDSRDAICERIRKYAPSLSGSEILKFIK
ncbi:MAG: hypothetical protein HUJ65_00685 [Oscillospiraceae bacterium]|nr:hypothetical protein [Oscillospiraceae bacterium]